MTRPPLEVADIVRAQGNCFITNHCRWIHWTHRKVLQAIARCRTAALGGHRDHCPRCGYQTISDNSCRNRHCPKCQNGARDRWVAARRNELLAVTYVHVVFTLPHQLSQLVLQNKKALYELLFQASAQTLLEVAADPKHLGADIGFLSVLHTWGQNLLPPSSARHGVRGTYRPVSRQQQVWRDAPQESRSGRFNFPIEFLPALGA